MDVSQGKRLTLGLLIQDEKDKLNQKEEELREIYRTVGKLHLRIEIFGENDLDTGEQVWLQALEEHDIPKLKAEIERIRTRLEKLETYSDA